MSKLTKRLVIFAAAMVMMLASSLTVFAKENEAIPRIVDNVMYVDEGSNNVWIYGVAVSIAGANKTDIVPNNPSKKVDVMANGKVFKQLDGVVLLKDEKKDRVFLEAGSVVIEAPTITEKALATLKANIAKNGVDSIAAAQVAATSADKSALAYGIATNGKAVMASGEEMSALLKTNANYVSILDAYEKAVEAAKEAAIAVQEAKIESSGGCDTPSTPCPTPAPEPLLEIIPIYVACNDESAHTAELVGTTLTITMGLETETIYWSYVLASSQKFDNYDDLMMAVEEEEESIDKGDMTETDRTIPIISAIENPSETVTLDVSDYTENNDYLYVVFGGMTL